MNKTLRAGGSSVNSSFIFDWEPAAHAFWPTSDLK
jgi:hypothetical protein